MEHLVVRDEKRLPLYHVDIDETIYEVSKEPLKVSSNTIRYYHGVVGLAHFVYDMAARILQLFFCSWSRPWPKWSWSTTKLVKDELIHLKKNTGDLKTHEFFHYLLEQAYLPFSTSEEELSADFLSIEFVEHSNIKSYGILIRRTYHGDFLTSTSLINHIGPTQENKICSFSRKKTDILEKQQGIFISRKILEEGSLMLSYADRTAFKREVVEHGMHLCGIKVVNQNSGHPVDQLLNFFEDTFLTVPKNGCTSVFFNQKDQELELRAIIPKDAVEVMSDKVEAFNRAQIHPNGNSAAICRAELTNISGDNPDITDIILAVKKVI